MVIMPSHVYLLSHVSRARFKVGKANDILSRARSFGWEDIDFERSLGLELSDEHAAHQLERLLLGAFYASRVPSEEVRKEGGRPDGATEWLRADCRPMLERFLDDVKGLFPHRRLDGHELAEDLRRRRLPSPSAIDREQRKQRELEKALAKREERALRFKQSREQRQLAIARMAGPLWNELTRLNHEGLLIGVCPRRSSCDVVLLRRRAQSEDDIWTLSVADTQCQWDGGVSSTVHYTAAMGTADMRLEAVGLSLVDHQGLLKSQAFLPHLGFLNGMPHIGEAELDAIFPPGFVVDEEGREARVAAAERLASRYPPFDERQIKRC